MAKPLVSDDPKPRDPSFSHFGVLDEGKRSRGATAISTGINVLIILFLIAVSVLVKTNPQLAAKLTPLYIPPVVKKMPPPKPPPLPKPPPELPKPPKLVDTPRKIDLPKPVELPDVKPMPAPPVPKPIQMSAPAPKMMVAAAAPKIVNMNMSAHAASIANNDAHPSAVRLGNPEMRALSGPAVATRVNLGGGMHNMSASNTGSGPVGKVSLGNGAPNGSAVKGGGIYQVKGLSTGVQGATGTGHRGPVSVGGFGTQMAKAPAAVQVRAAMAKPPVISGTPKAIRTAEAKANHVSGDVRVRIVLHANGSVSVGEVVSGLPDGLDEVARRVAAGIRFTPAKDTNGNSVDFPTVVTIHFLTND
ncbi:MAG: TonB family protein [Bryocella sp.]